MAEEQLAEQQNRRRQLLDENGFADDVVSDVAQRLFPPPLISMFEQCCQCVPLFSLLLISCAVLIMSMQFSALHVRNTELLSRLQIGIVNTYTLVADAMHHQSLLC
jgi:hypothetical protein